MQTSYKRINCLHCGKALKKKIITLNNMPSSAQDLPTKEELGEDYGIELSLYECDHCGLVQFNCSPVSYYKDVIRASAFNESLRKIKTEQLKKLIYDNNLSNKKIIEIGCGKGEFLSLLNGLPVKSYGIEHNQESVEVAQKNNLNVWKDFASNGKHIIKPNDCSNEKFDAFFSFNFLEHQPDPLEMIRCIYNNLKYGGVGLITVPSLEYISEHASYYELMRDHITYYSFNTLRKILNEAGFSIINEEFSNEDTNVYWVRKDKTIKNYDISIEDNYKSLNYDKIIQSYESISREINALVDNLKSLNKTLTIWGASHQCFTLAATTKLGEYATQIIDSATFKQNKYAPAIHKEIISPDAFIKRPTDIIFIVVPGFYKDIFDIIKDKYINKNNLNVEVYSIFSNIISRLN